MDTKKKVGLKKTTFSAEKDQNENVKNPSKKKTLPFYEKDKNKQQSLPDGAEMKDNADE